MRLPMRDVATLYGSLDGLMKGGNAQIVRKNNEDTLAIIPFKLSADVYQWSATMMQRLHPLIEAYKVATQNAFKGHLPEGKDSLKLGTAAHGAYVEDQQNLDAEPTSFRALILPIASLKLDDNPGIAPHLAGLMPILRAEKVKGAEEEKDEESTETT